jgi:hypothetical protein
MRLAWLVPVVALIVSATTAHAQLGLGVRASSVRYEEDRHAEGLGALLRWRLPLVELELEVAHEPHAASDRADTRAGLGLLVPIGTAGLRPYVAASLGANRVTAPAVDPVLQGYLSIGGGLTLDIVSQHLSLGFDVRYTIRRAGGEIFDREEAIEGRVTGVVYF